MDDYYQCLKHRGVVTEGLLISIVAWCGAKCHFSFSLVFNHTVADFFV